MTSIFEGQPPKNKVFSNKTRVIWVDTSTGKWNIFYKYLSKKDHLGSTFRMRKQTPVFWWENVHGFWTQKSHGRFGWKKGWKFSPDFNEGRFLGSSRSFCGGVDPSKLWKIGFLKKKWDCLRTHTMLKSILSGSKIPCYRKGGKGAWNNSLFFVSIRLNHDIFWGSPTWILTNYSISSGSMYGICIFTYTLVIVSSLRLNFPPETLGFQLFLPVLSSFNRSKISSNCSPCTATPLWISWGPDQWKGLTCIGKLFE